MRSTMLAPSPSPPPPKRQGVLFKNPLTMRRFPELAAIPKEQLVAYFGVGGAVGEKSVKPRGEPIAEVTEPPKLPRKPPFVPCNPSQARQGINNKRPSIFHGTDYDSVKQFSSIARRKHDSTVAGISTQTFSPVCPSLARGAIQCIVYQNSPSEHTFFADRTETIERAKGNVASYTTETRRLHRMELSGRIQK